MVYFDILVECFHAQIRLPSTCPTCLVEYFHWCFFIFMRSGIHIMDVLSVTVYMSQSYALLNYDSR